MENLVSANPFFLNHFFKDDTQGKIFQRKKYNVFNISPVNYSVGSNEDIFRYVKYDIIVSMILQKIQIEDNDISYLKTLPSFILKNLHKVFAAIIYMIPKIGKDIYDSFEKFDKLKEEFLKYHDEQIESAETQLDNYLSSIELREGSIYEGDVITKLIKNILERLKGNHDEEMENLLVIDDLDRIDPEHIFRLLNVFGAHMDTKEKLINKFGFDKIIIVCDIQNIRNIFHARYGSNVDFNGYIDKFYSNRPFYFDNRKILNKISHQYFRTVNFPDETGYALGSLQNSIFSRRTFVVELLEIFISNGHISLRNLLHKSNHSTIMSSYVNFSYSTSVHIRENPELVHLKILKDIVGGYPFIKDIFEKIPSENLNLININSTCQRLLFFVTHDKHNLTIKEEFFTHQHGDILLNVKTLKSVNDEFSTSAELVENKNGAINVLSKPYLFKRSDLTILFYEFIDLVNRLDI